MGKVIHPEKFASKADRTFPPLLTQEELDTRSADERCAALAQKLRFRCIVVALLGIIPGWWPLTIYLTFCAIVAPTLARWLDRRTHGYF